MIFGEGLFGLVLLGLWLFCVIDVITTDESQVRNLPKLLWLLIVVLLFDIGSIAWLVAGRPWAARGAGMAYRGTAGRGPSGRGPSGGARRVSNPDDDEEFLAGLRARAEEQRRRAREAGDQEPPPA